MIQTTADYSLKIMKVRRSDNEIFQLWKKRTVNQELYSSKNILQE